jgi:valyl-tRNA synthetase
MINKIFTKLYFHNLRFAKGICSELVMPYNLQVKHAEDSQFFQTREWNLQKFIQMYVLMIYPTIILKIRYQVNMTKICKFVILTSTKQVVKGKKEGKEAKSTSL